MVPLSLEVVAEVIGGHVEGDPGVVVGGPVVIDGREARAGSLFAAFVGERVDGHEHVPQATANGALAVLGTRGTELPTVVVADPQRALQRLAQYVVAQVRTDALQVVALTGSQGKTSTKDLLAAVLDEAGKTVATHGSFNNELGMPLTALRVEPDTRYLVLEMGARGRGHLTELTDLVRPDVSVVLNVGTAHLGEFGSRDAIAAAKGELVEALGEGGVAVLNADDERVAAMASRTAGRVLTFGESAGADVRLEELTLDRFSRPRFRLGGQPVELQLVGAHQALNAAAAAAAATAVGLPLDRTIAALEGVRSLSKWRMELHELPSGVVLLNDSYNANPESMRAALDALASFEGVRRRIAVLGEMLELGDGSEAAHRAVGEYAAARADLVLAVGPGASALGGVPVADNDAAVAWLRAELREGDAVLVKASRGARLDEVAAALL